MDFRTELPTAPPPAQQRSYPWTKRVDYRSGKVAQAFAAQAMPENVKAGFSYYDSEAKSSISLEAFQAIVVASLSGIAGVTKEGDRYYNYYSNLVKDTRTDVLAVRMQGVDKVIGTGLYSELKETLPSGVGYTQVLICYVKEYDQIMALNLTVGLQNHLKNAIAVATSTQASKVNLFGLCDLITQFWGFSFTGKFVKTDKEGKPWSGTGDMYFMPECNAFVVNKAGNEDAFVMLNEGSAACFEYVQREQDKIYGATKAVESAPISAPARKHIGNDDFPTNDTTSYSEEAPSPHGDDLPF
jgi:hypothetical protein